MVFVELALVGGILIGGILWFTEGLRFQAAYHILRNAPGPIRELDGSRGLAPSGRHRSATHCL